MEYSLYVKEGRNRTNLPFEEVLFMEKFGAKIILYTEEREYRFYSTFITLIPQLDSRFASPHESYIFNMDKIRSIEENCVYMVDGKCIQMCEKCIRRLRKKMDENACKH